MNKNTIEKYRFEWPGFGGQNTNTNEYTNRNILARIDYLGWLLSLRQVWKKQQKNKYTNTKSYDIDYLGTLVLEWLGVGGPPLPLQPKDLPKFGPSCLGYHCTVPQWIPLHCAMHLDSIAKRKKDPALDTMALCHNIHPSVHILLCNLQTETWSCLGYRCTAMDIWFWKHSSLQFAIDNPALDTFALCHTLG